MSKCFLCRAYSDPHHDNIPLCDYCYEQAADPNNSLYNPKLIQALAVK